MSIGRDTLVFGWVDLPSFCIFDLGGLKFETPEQQGFNFFFLFLLNRLRGNTPGQSDPVDGQGHESIMVRCFQRNV